MPDNKDKRRPRDASRVNIHEDYEVSYWSRAFNTTKEKLKEAVSRAGTSSEAVRKFLGKH